MGLKSFKGFLLLSLSLLVQNAFASADGFGVTVSQTSYAGDPQIVEQEGQYSFAMPSLKFLSIWGDVNGSHSIVGFDGLAVLPMSESADLGVAIPEAYFQVIPDKRVSFAIGRKKENWSELDSYWDLGLWQPLVRWDAASPIEQGLAGLFFDIKNDGYFRAVVMVSGLFLPDQQPDFAEENGRIISTNRWFRAPVSGLSIGNGYKVVNYHVVKPDPADIVKQNSYALMLSLGDERSGLFAKFSATDKPANQFHLGIVQKKILNISKKDSVVDANIHPMVVRHKLYTLESGYGWEYSRLVLSANWEGFEKPTVSPDWEQTALIDSRYDGLIFNQSLQPLGIKRTTVGFSYVRHHLNNDAQEATLIKGDIEASTQRFAFDEMAGVQLNTNFIRTYQLQLDAQLKYVYSIFDSGEWFQAGLQLKQGRNWIWNLSGDVFGVPEDTSASTSFISKYRGNDRVSGSLTYVF